MSLHWNLSDTLYHTQDEATKQKEWPVVETVIMLTMPVGMGAITEKNVTEVIARIRLLETLHGAFLHTSGGKDKPIPEELIQKLIGLRTNVSPERWQTFATRVVNRWRSELTHQLAKEMAKKAAANAKIAAAAGLTPQPA